MKNRGRDTIAADEIAAKELSLAEIKALDLKKGDVRQLTHPKPLKSKNLKGKPPGTRSLRPLSGPIQK